MNAATTKRLAAIEGRAIVNALHELRAAVNVREQAITKCGLGAHFVAEVGRLGLDIAPRDGEPLTAEAIDADVYLLRDVVTAVRAAEPVSEPGPIALLWHWGEYGGDPFPVAQAFARKFAFAFPPQTPPLAVLRDLAALFRGEFGLEQQAQ